MRWQIVFLLLWSVFKSVQNLYSLAMMTFNKKLRIKQWSVQVFLSVKGNDQWRMKCDIHYCTPHLHILQSLRKLAIHTCYNNWGGGEYWWIFAELRSSKVNIHHHSPTRRWIINYCCSMCNTSSINSAKNYSSCNN